MSTEIKWCRKSEGYSICWYDYCLRIQHITRFRATALSIRLVLITTGNSHHMSTKRKYTIRLVFITTGNSHHMSTEIN
jgi:hypothetical protein